MVIATGKVDIIEIRHLLKHNPAPFLEILNKINPPRDARAASYDIDFGKFRDVDDFLSQVKKLVHDRVPMPKPLPKKVYWLKATWIALSLLIGLLIFLSQLLTYLDSLYAFLSIDTSNFNMVLGLLGFMVGMFTIPFSPQLFITKVGSLEAAFPKIVSYLDSRENFTTIRELTTATRTSRKQILTTITTFGKGIKRESIYAAIKKVRRYDSGKINDLLKNIPQEETFYFLPQVDGVMRVPKINPPLRLEQTAFDRLWGMLLVEKKIEFSLAAKGLHLPKYRLLKLIYKILAGTPMKFQFTGTSLNLVEEQDLDALFAELKNMISTW